MSQSIRSEPIHEPLDDEERVLMDPNSWDWGSTVEGVTAGEPRASLTLPPPFDEPDAIVEAAHAQALSTETFIKRQMLDGLHAARAQETGVGAPILSVSPPSLMTTLLRPRLSRGAPRLWTFSLPGPRRPPA